MFERGSGALKEAEKGFLILYPKPSGADGDEKDGHKRVAKIPLVSY